MQKRVKEMVDSPESVDTISAKKRNNSRSALEALEVSNTSVLSSEALLTENGTPKKNERRFMVCHELLDTEDNYLNVLNVLINVFKNPLEAMIRSEGERDLLSMKELHILFKKIEPIQHVHTYIQENLQKQIDNWKNTNLVGKIWADIASDLERVYPPYINSYDDILKTLDYCDSMHAKFHAFLKYAETRPECQKNSVRDLLIRPVQRIPSVLLLLQELQKRTERNNPDYQWVRGAVDLLKGVLMKTNESRRRTEDFQRFMEVCQEIEELPADVIASNREFVQSIDVVVLNAGGALHKYKGSKIGLFLFNDVVELAKCRFCSSEHNQSHNCTLDSSFNSGSSSNNSCRTLTRQMSLGMLRRGASWRKQRRQYKHINLHRFSHFRSVELEREHGVFIVKIRYDKSDELCFFQPTNGYTLDISMDFFTNLVQRIRATSSTREIDLEEVTVAQIREQRENRPEEVESILKAIKIAAELNSTGTIRRPSQLRRSVSQLSLSLHRIPSFKKATLGNIRE